MCCSYLFLLECETEIYMLHFSMNKQFCDESGLIYARKIINDIESPRFEIYKIIVFQTTFCNYSKLHNTKIVHEGEKGR